MNFIHNNKVYIYIHIYYNTNDKIRWLIVYVGPWGVCVCGRISPPVGRGHAVEGREAGRRRGPRILAICCAPSGEVEERGGEEDLRGQGGLPFLP